MQSKHRFFFKKRCGYPPSPAKYLWLLLCPYAAATGLVLWGVVSCFEDFFGRFFCFAGACCCWLADIFLIATLLQFFLLALSACCCRLALLACGHFVCAYGANYLPQQFFLIATLLQFFRLFCLLCKGLLCLACGHFFFAIFFFRQVKLNEWRRRQ